jgi:putative sterol carrier protein
MPIDIASTDHVESVELAAALLPEAQLIAPTAAKFLAKQDKKSMTTLNEIIQVLEEKSAGVEAFDKKIKLVLDGHDIIINGYTQPLTIETEDTDGEVDVTASATLENFGKIIHKKVNVQMAMMSGKIKIEGNMIAAVPLMKLL